MTTLLVRFLSFLLRFISFDKLHFLSDFFYLFLKRYRSREVSENLKFAFPAENKENLINLKRSYYKNLCNVILESLKAFKSSQEEIAKRFVFNNPEVANRYDGKRSIILVLGHIANWEWGQAVVSHYLTHKCIGVYKPLSDEVFNKYLLSKRSQYNVKLLPQKNLIKYLISNQSDYNVYIFITDQYPPKEPRIDVSFLNQESFFDSSVEKIARKYNLPVIYADIKKTGPARYETELIEICKDSNKTAEGFITKQYAQLLENNILLKPELWLWSHRRWKNIRPKS